MALAKAYGYNVNDLYLLNTMKSQHQDALYLSWGMGDMIEK